MLLDNKPYTLDRIARIAISLAMLWGLIWLLGRLSDVLVPFAAAFLLAYLINPLAMLIQRRVKRRGPAVFLALAIVVAVLTLACVVLIPMVGREIARMGSIVTGLVGDSELAERAAKLLPPNVWQAVKKSLATQEIQDLFKDDAVMKLAGGISRRVLPGVWGVITGAASFAMGLVGLTVVGLYLMFLLLDYQRVKEGWKELIPPVYREGVVSFVDEFNQAMNRYFRAQAAVASIVGLLFAAGFTIIQLPMGIVLGLFIGLLNMVPYLQIIGFFPAVVLAVLHAIVTGGNIWVSMGLTLLIFAVVQTIQDTILVPRIMGKVTGLNPAMILLSLSIWGKLFGFFGLLIALPMTCLLLAYYHRFLSSAAFSHVAE
jgi:predicted PurR-regulated permease PerM